MDIGHYTKSIYANVKARFNKYKKEKELEHSVTEEIEFSAMDENQPHEGN